MDTDRNLLFGVLALQADLIDPAQFVEACTLWATHKDIPLAQLLIERGWLVPSDQAHLDYLLQRKVNKHHGDVRASLAAAPDDVKRTLAALGDAEIQNSLAELPRTEIPPLEATVDYVCETRERYTLTRLHATGGIGRVWLAHDSALGRDVALKELRPERAEQATLGARFLQEAQITGQLEHPGIIPVYELVRARDGRQPFYTMRFVRGRTLSEAARTYHDRRRAGQADPLELPALLNAFVTVCNTVAYAHSRGVIHRDLKGQNVLLGDFGEVVVLDWGLAKLVGRPERDDPARSVVHAETGADSGYTLQGQALGTPAYMAPEQAVGRLDLIDRRTDVYGLGAILYEILTGRPPFTADSTEEVLRKVREEGPAFPRETWPEVPPALEPLCLRALAKQAADRPAAAADLAHEVQGWQEFERRKAEEALRESEALYHSLVETLPLSVWRKNLEGRFTFGNRGFCESVGSALTDLIGKTDFDFFPAELAAKYRQDDLRVHQTGRPYATAEEHVTRRGEALHVEVVKSPIFDVSGQVVGTQGIFWDVTARKRAEEELRRSRERFELAVQGSQDGLWDWDLTTDEVYYSPRYKAMLGYEDHEFPNQRGEWEKRVHPNDLDRVKSEMRAHFQSCESLSWVEFRFEHKDSSYRWIRSRAFVLRDPTGRVYRMAGSHEDITERKAAEEAVRISEERYRSIIAAMQDGIALLDTNGHIRACNASAERILGLSADQMMGRTPHDPRWRSIHADGSPFPGETHPPIVTLRTGQPCRDVVMGVHKPDGTLTWISINSQPLYRADGHTLDGVVASFEDITDRRRTEEALRQTTLELTRLQQRAGEGILKLS
jgi:PAS domain S-box-containing protein